MVLRSCFCYKKCPTLSTKRTITHARNNILLAVKPKYPGVLIQQQYVPQLSMSTTGSKIEKIEIPIVANKPLDNLDPLFTKQLGPKQATAMYRSIAKRTPHDIFNMFAARLDTLDYTQLRPIFIEAASFWPPDTIHKIVSLCKGKYVPWRLDLLNSLQSSYVLTKDLNILIGALPESGSPPCDILPFYNTVLNKCLKQNQLEHMHAVMEIMKQRCIDPDTATSNILTRMQLNNCTTPEQTLDVYNDIIKQGIKPNQVTFNTFIKHACQHQHFDLLDIWLDKMQHEAGGPNSITVRILFKSYVDHPTNDKVIQVFDRVSKQVPIKGKERLLNTGIARLLKLKQTKAAMDLLDKTFELDQPLSIYSYNLLLQSLCLDGKVETAQQVLDNMILRDNDNIPKPDIVSFTTLIHGFIRNSSQVDPTKIGTVYRQLLDQGLQSNNVLQSVMLYGLMRSNQTKDLTKIKGMFESILAHKQETSVPRLPTDKPLNEINVYNMMMDFYFLHYHHSDTLRNQVPREPFELLQDAVETKKLKPTVTTLNILVRGLAILNKDLNGAEKMVSLLKEKGVEMDEKTCWYLTKSAYSQGQITRARQWIDQFEAQNNSVQGSGLQNLKSILTKWDSK
ncbi:hypothetical protein MFLAVUS_008828 [Mucor flavus]|uniref:Uncharacterized protein n=1 Tax=Mucor flavus TaxID=439312 RepID=A0ABP9Z8D1_9FUNG